MMKENQSGRTMLEMLGVLAIMGIIAYGTISGINYGMTSYKVNKLYIEVGDIINGIQDMYLTVYGKGGYYGSSLSCDTTTDPCSDDCKALITNGFLSKSSNKENTCANTQELIISLSNSGLTVTVKAPSENFCTRLKNMDWDVQSVNCYVNNSLTSKCLNNNCSDDNKLYFTPK